MVSCLRQFVWLLLCLNLTGPLFAHSPFIRPAMSRFPVWLGNQAGVSANVVSHARSYMAEVFEDIGVQVVWVDDPRPLPRPLIALIVPGSRAKSLGPVERAALGVTLRNEQPSGLVYVFYDRVETTAIQHRVDTSSVLGATLAHEAAHAILRRDAHTRAGLMRASWDEQEFRLMRGGLLLFSSRDGEAIRSVLEIHSLE
jgi:hypothetical protein